MEDKIRSVISDLYGIEADVKMTRPDPKFGDWATNVALQLASRLGNNPRQIAEEIAHALLDSGDYSEVSVAGPGFINLRVADNTFVDQIERPFALSREGLNVVVETNCPNPFKAMHIGHAFNSILGDTVANLLDVSGATVHRVSYHGDVGAHVGRCMYALLKYADGDVTRLMEIPEAEHNTFLSQMYAEGARTYKEGDESIKQEIDRLAQQSFTLDDPLYKTIYELGKSWSFAGIDHDVALLGNKPIEKRYLESQADAIGVETVKANAPRVFQLSDGAYVFPGSKYGSFDNVFVASNGRGLYAARDLGLMQLKQADYHPDKSYTVTAEEQRDYFRGVITAASQCMPELDGVTVNVSTGTLKLTTGKMSSRSGDVVEIAWLFDKIASAIKARGGVPTDEMIAGAIRYQFLKIRIGSDVVFDVSEAVSLQGNTGSYLQYAHARACSILSKSSMTPADMVSAEFDATERVLLAKMSELSEVVSRAADELLPHYITTYLYELAQTFNRFYEQSRIIGHEREAVRLGLVRHYQQTLSRGLGVLGIVAPERM